MNTTNIKINDIIRSWDFGQPLPGEGPQRISYMEGTVTSLEQGRIEFVCTKRVRCNEDRTDEFIGSTYYTPFQGALLGDDPTSPRVEVIS